MKVKRRDVLTLNMVLDLIAGRPASSVFTYRMAKNKRTITPEVESVREAFKQSPEYIEFEQKRQALCEVHSAKGEDGKAVVAGGKYAIIDMAKFEVELVEIKTGYTDAIAEQSRKDEELEKFADEEIILKLLLVSPEDIPDGLTMEEVDALDVVIKG